MCGRCVCWCFLIFTWVEMSAGSLSTDCPAYVLENHNLNCLCKTTDGTVTWPGHSLNGTLIVPNVQRAQNGTKYTCRLEGGGGEGGGERESLTYTLRVAYGPFQETLSITADQQPFPTNGSQRLVLMCHTGEVYPTPDFTWREVTCADNTQVTNACVVKPQPPEDDGKKARCSVNRKFGIDLPQGLIGTVYTIQLTYPPFSTPYIQIQAKDPHLLRKGDNLVCSIKGGKPGISKVVFSCSSPYQADAMDEGEEGGVNSTVTVSSLSPWRHPMHCVCHGVWNVRPEYYTLTAEGFYYVEHPAVVTNFTINGSRDDVTTVKGDTNTSLHFLCFTYGRPAPTEGHFSKVNSTAFNSSDYRTTRTMLGNWTTEFRMWIEGVRCEDMGRYLCSVDNGVGEGETASLTLQVECGPRRLTDMVLELMENRIRFSLNAFPVPDRFLFYHLHGNRSPPLNSSLIDSSKFYAKCRQDDVILYQVNCEIKPLAISAQLLGEYRATVGNALGSVNISFSINTTVTPGGVDEGLSQVGIAGVVVGSIGALVIIIVVVVVVIRYLQRQRRKEALGRTSDDVDGGSANQPGDETAGHGEPTLGTEISACVTDTGPYEDLKHSDIGLRSVYSVLSDPVSTTSRYTPETDDGYEIHRQRPVPAAATEI